MGWLERLRKKFQPRSTYPLVATFDEKGILQKRGREEVFIAWEHLVWIVAYKKDCFTIDDIRLIFNDGVNQIEISEDVQKMEDVKSVLEGKLPLVVPHWHEQLIVSPAFDETPIVVYERAETALQITR